MREVGMKIFVLIGKALGIDVKEIKESLGEGGQSIRINYYPPCPKPETVIGLKPHTDGSALTILLQANEVQGLQIYKHGTWLPIQPLPNAFIISLGDVMEVTNSTFIVKVFFFRSISIRDKIKIKLRQTLSYRLVL